MPKSIVRCSESDDDDGDPSVDDDTKRDVDSYETADKELGQIPRCENRN